MIPSVGYCPTCKLPTGPTCRCGGERDVINYCPSCGNMLQAVNKAYASCRRPGCSKRNLMVRVFPPIKNEIEASSLKKLRERAMDVAQRARGKGTGLSRRESLEVAAGIIQAALIRERAEAWDEGFAGCVKDLNGNERQSNPYRSLLQSSLGEAE